MTFTPKHGYCLGKRRKWMLYFLFCLNPSFSKEKTAPILKYPLHRKQFLFKRRVWFGSFDCFSALRLLFSLLYQCHSLQLVKIKGKVLIQSVRRPTLLVEIPYSSCLLPTWQGQVARAGAHSHPQLRLAHTSGVFRTEAVFLAFPQTTGTLRCDLNCCVVTKKERRALATLGLPLV